jgi:RNA polymerase sigma-32 factor
MDESIEFEVDIDSAPDLEPEVRSNDDDESSEDTERLLPVVRSKRSVGPLDSLSSYLNQVRQYQALSEDEERQLAIEYQKTGDPAAVYRLITSNLKVVVQVAMKFKREWENLMDLIQEGNVGLMHAVKNFDPFRGVRLPVYANWWIKAYMLKYILDNWRLVRVGTTNSRRKLLYNLNKEKEKLEREGYAPTTKLLAERFNVKERDVIDVESSLGASDMSMDTPLNDENSITPSQYLTHGAHPEVEVEKSQFFDLLREKVAEFSKATRPMEKAIIKNRVLSDNPQSLQEIGDAHNVTREAVRQAEQRLLKKLRAFLAEHMPEAADKF